MAGLPHIYLNWDESAHPIAEFLRYQVYRREAGEEDWTRIARINQRDINFYPDYTVASGVDYEYAVTVIRDEAGEEVESAFPTEVGARVDFEGVYLHDVFNPSNYAELRVTAVTKTVGQDINLVQTWGRQQPIGYVGSAEAEQVRLAFANTNMAEQWESLRLLVRRQRTRGSVVCFRSEQGDRIFALITASGRTSTKFAYQPSLELSEVYFEEAV